MCTKCISGDLAATVVVEENHKHALTFIEVYEEHLSKSQLDILRHVSKIAGFELICITSEKKSTSDKTVSTAEFGFGYGECKGNLIITF